ncbi:MAG TPA: (d)CMP kinase [Candidatus Deferrimicrobium sp.]|nr:(d)CMP kinase [Candidatus Deferrimicrobium sp.]
MQHKINIAIDGPAGAGKSTVAKIVANRLGLVYIDTGAMYRALTWKALAQKADLLDEQILTELAGCTEITLALSPSGPIIVSCDDQDVSEEIRNQEVTASVSTVASLAGVRRRMVELQQKMAAQGGVVMDGRDIGTHVLPNAKYKFFLTATLQQRAKRRWLEMKAKGQNIDLAALEQQIAERDRLDSSRETAPLVAAVDAIWIDTDTLSIEDVVEKIVVHCRGEA